MSEIKRDCECGGRYSLLFSTGEKICCDCKKVVEWKLDEGQESVFDECVSEEDS